jgi:two-component system, LytTR family, response regulator
MIRAIIVDDEPLAIESLEIILKKKCRDDVQVIATSNSPQLGRSLIEEHQPDLVFLDVEMPGMSGIDLVRSFSNPTFRVVFITAFDEYAIEALRLSAIDYLLKPVEADDIVSLVAKVKAQIKKKENLLSSQLLNLEKILSQSVVSSESRIGIAMADKIVFVNISDILYCEAKGVYTNIYLHDGKKILASKPLGDFESQLNTQKFFRIHHSTLINLNHIKEFQRFNGGYVVMQNNVKLEVSHRKRKDFLDAIDDQVV